MKKLYIHTFGCKINQYESQLIKQKYTDNGFIFVDNFNAADTIIVNSCSVTAYADKEVIDYMNSFPITREVIDNLTLHLTRHLKEIAKSGRGNYTIGIACSGGQHRSTYVANYLAEYFSKDYRTQAIHRDCPQLNKESD